MRPERALVRPIAWLLSLALALMGLSVVAPASADGTPTGHITGLVTGPGGTPIRNVTIQVASIFSGSWSLVGSTSTGPDGRYEYDGALEFVPHLLRFTHPNYVPEFYDNAATAATATIVQVTAGGTSVANAELAVAGDDPGPVPVPATPAVANAILPTISGSAQVGVTVTASPGSWTPASASPAYQWLIDGSPVTGATTASYTPVAGDAGRSLQVRVTASTSGYTAATATSTAIAVGTGTLTATKKPQVTGKAKKNATLKVSPGTWSTKVTVSYTWYAGAKAIPKATAAKLKLAGKTLKAVAGKAISVLVTVAAPGYRTVSTRFKMPGRLGR
jgi:hypothetical protein